MIPTDTKVAATPQNVGNTFHGVEGVWDQLLGGQGARTCVILVFRECIWNAPAVLLALPALDATGSLGFLPRPVVYPPVLMVPPWVTASRFLAGSRKAELKLPTFSSLILFRVFLSSFFS